MATRICSYNVEWFDHLFDKDNNLITFEPQNKKHKELKKQLEGLKKVFETVKADLYGIVEAPNTSTTTGNQSTVEKLKNFFLHIGLNNYEVITGFISPGKQELALIYNKDKLEVKYKPGGTNTKKNPPFDGVLEYDTDDDKIKEIYKFYRPPLEAEITIKQTNEKFYLILVHAKSKGIFTSVDMVKWEKENLRNRRKLFAECTWIRRRVDEWLDKNRKVVVMGDINDGPGMDFYEARFGRSAVETIMGDIFEPEKMLKNYVGRPKWGQYGWEPSSTRFTDRFTETPVNALIDHIMLSQDIPCSSDKIKIWNPYILDEAKPIKFDLIAASDHFPVTADIF
ncbi:MAG: hypothetical protein H8D45_32860 [Bacteroidetes bacterium]|nr:hypothetical protein [Bacteroidota bacterium]MBL7102716.1 hypothetical protein [Bacteroidales bacterium]